MGKESVCLGLSSHIQKSPVYGVSPLLVCLLIGYMGWFAESGHRMCGSGCFLLVPSPRRTSLSGQYPHLLASQWLLPVGVHSDQFGGVWILYVLCGKVRMRSFTLHLHFSEARLFCGKCCLSVLYPWNFSCLLAFMFLYTTLFGILVSVVYVRTGSLVAASAVHALCNFFSIPSVEFLREQSPLYEKRYCPHCCSILMFRYLGKLSGRYHSLLRSLHDASEPCMVPQPVLFNDWVVSLLFEQINWNHDDPLGRLCQYWDPAENTIAWGKHHSFGTLSTIQYYLHRSM